MVVQREVGDIVLVPIYGMMNHISDPEKLNTDTDNNSVYSTEGLRAWASKNIEAGEEFFFPTTTVVIATMTGAPRKSFVILDL
jgi:hypothetical protein